MNNSKIIIIVSSIFSLFLIGSIIAYPPTIHDNKIYPELIEINLTDGIPTIPSGRSDCDFLSYYDDTATSIYAWELRSDEGMISTRFSVPEGYACSLKTSWILHNGNLIVEIPRLIAYLYSDDGYGAPDLLLDSVILPIIMPGSGLQWISADFSGGNWVFHSGEEYHLGWRTVNFGLSGWFVIFSDQATGSHSGEERAYISDFAGDFVPVVSVLGDDYLWFMESYHCCIPDPQLSGACCDLITGDCQIKLEEDCNRFYEYYQGNGTTCEQVTCPIPNPPCDAGNLSVCVDGIINSDGASISEIKCGEEFSFLLRFRNFSGEELTGFSHGFKIYSDNNVCWSPLEFDTAGGIGDYVFPGPIITPNGFTGCGADTFGFSGNSIFPPHIPNGYDDVVLLIKTSVDCEFEGGTICIDSSFIPPAGIWMWSLVSGSMLPSWGGPYCFDITTCCNHDGIRGDADNNYTINVADLTYLVDYLFKGGAEPPCSEEADVNIDNEVLVDDLVYLVNYLFKGGHPPEPC